MQSAAPHSGDVLRGICHAFGSVSDPVQAVESTLDWVHRALGDVPCTICLVLPDHAGRLRLAAVRGPMVSEGRLRSARRRRAFVTKRPLRVDLRDGAGGALHTFPLVSRGESVGVVEVIAQGDVLEDRMDVLEAVLGQAASVLRNTREREESERVVHGLVATVSLSASMLRAESPVRSIRAATTLCQDYLALPAVGWLPEAPGGDGVLVTRGFGPRRRSGVRRVLEQVGAVPLAQVAEVVGEALEPLVGVRPTVVRAGDAFLAVAGTPTEAGTVLLHTVASLLADSLRTMTTVAEAKARTDGLDVGIAWTAHELREPLLGARTAIDHLISLNDREMETDLLRHARDELEQLAGLVDPLLRWSTGGQLNKRRTDLVKVVREAVASSALGRGDRRVELSAPPALEVLADPKHMRSAVANLVRNALKYAPDHTVVTVEVGGANGTVWICVRDGGPGVPAEEGQMIFDLFARGSGAHNARNGAGLGLFITRRVVEAHGGTVRVLPSSEGASFIIELPEVIERSAASAS